MTYSVYQHWDPLKVCVVGRSYPPEFYSWIKIPHVRKLFESIATETAKIRTIFLNIIVDYIQMHTTIFLSTYKNKETRSTHTWAEIMAE
jgi:hypothetical protein